MNTLGQIVIDSRVYYSADDIKNKARAFAGSARNAREMVRQRKIPSDGYIYVRKQPGATTYKKTDGSASQDRVYFTEAFAKTIAELNPTATREQVASSAPRVANATSEEKVEQEKAPDIIELDDDEKFHDDEGNVLEIETRGERTYDGIYFRVKDVSSGFGIERLKDTLVNPNSGYTRNIDYKAFACSEAINYGCKTTNTAKRKYVFVFDPPGSDASVVGQYKGHTRNIDHTVFACSEVINDDRKTTSTASANKHMFVSDLPRSAASVVEYDKDTHVV